MTLLIPEKLRMTETVDLQAKRPPEESSNLEYLLFVTFILAALFSAGIVVRYIVMDYHDSATSKVSPPPPYSGPKPVSRAVKRPSYFIHCERYSGPNLVPCARGRLRAMW